MIIVEGRSNFINCIKCVVYGLTYRKPVYQWGLGELKNATKIDRLKSLPFLIFERLSTGAIAYSSLGAKYYMNVVKMDPCRVYTAVNTIDDRHISVGPIRSAPLGSFNFLFVGAIEPQKRVGVLIHALSIVANEAINSSLSIRPVLDIVGDGFELANCRNLASKLGVDSAISFHGALFGSQLARTFERSDLLVMPGLGGLVVSESICYNLPVLCSVGDGSEVDWLSNGSGVISDFRSADQLAQEMMRFLLDPDLIPEMSLKCSESRKKHSFNAYANVFLDVIYESTQKNEEACRDGGR
jgi:glycosyltransferase involved in cell wall biosynthesis